MSAIALLIPGQITAGSATGEAKPAGGVPGAQAQGMGALFQLLLNGNAGAGDVALPVVTDAGTAPVPMTLPAGLLPNAIPADGGIPQAGLMPEQQGGSVDLPANLLAFTAPTPQTPDQLAVTASLAAEMPEAVPAVMPVPAIATPAQPLAAHLATGPVSTVSPASDSTDTTGNAVAIVTSTVKPVRNLQPVADDSVAPADGAQKDGAEDSPQPVSATPLPVPMPLALVPVNTQVQTVATVATPATVRAAAGPAVTTVADDEVVVAANEEPSSKPANSVFADTLGKTAQPERSEMPGAVSASASTGKASVSDIAAAPAAGMGEVQQEAKPAPQPVAESPVDVAAANATHALSHPTVEKMQAAQHTANDNANTVRDTPAGQVSVQLAHAVRTGESRIDVALTPVELGRVEIRLEIARDGSASAQIVAERADTLDLLKRDASTLERVLQESGLRTDSSSLSFNLRGEGQRNQQQQNAPSTPAPYAQPLVADEDHPVIQRRYAWQSDSGLDISV